MKHADQTTYRDLAAYAEGEVTPSDRAAVEAALLTSAEAQKRLARIQTVTAHLRDTASVEDIDLLPGLLPTLEATRRAMPSTPARGLFSYRVVGLVAAAALALVTVSLFVTTRGGTWDSSSEEFRVKSALPHGDARSRWIAFNAFRLSDEAQPEQVRDTLHADDGLLFSYTNLGPKPFSYLMIFAVDVNRRVYWYYPAFLDAKDNPKSISIDKGVSRVGLREVIAHPFSKGSLNLFALFSDNMLSVSDIETAALNGVNTGDGFEAAFEGVRVKTLTLEVAP